MSLTSKSPERVAREALAVVATALPRYPHRFSSKIYPQPQLFACLVLKTFFTIDYRGIAQLLAIKGQKGINGVGGHSFEKKPVFQDSVV